jgi:hypothetical protein
MGDFDAPNNTLAAGDKPMHVDSNANTVHRSLRLPDLSARGNAEKMHMRRRSAFGVRRSAANKAGKAAVSGRRSAGGRQRSGNDDGWTSQRLVPTAGKRDAAHRAAATPGRLAVD